MILPIGVQAFTTIESLAADNSQPVQLAWIEHDIPQRLLPVRTDLVAMFWRPKLPILPIQRLTVRLATFFDVELTADPYGDSSRRRA